MSDGPTAFQRTLHTVIAQRFVTQLLSRVTEPADKFLLALTGNRHTFTELVGWPIIELETVGAHSGLRRIHPLIGMPMEKSFLLIGSNFGRAHHPAWVHNLRAHPDCVVKANGRTGKYLAREAQGAERQQCWQIALSNYKGYAEYEKRAAPRIISVWILESQE